MHSTMALHSVHTTFLTALHYIIDKMCTQVLVMQHCNGGSLKAYLKKRRSTLLMSGTTSAAWLLPFRGPASGPGAIAGRQQGVERAAAGGGARRTATAWNMPTVLHIMTQVGAIHAGTSPRGVGKGWSVCLVWGWSWGWSLHR